MKILIIGGGIFVGRHITDALLSAGHKVTHFNRAVSAPPRADVEVVKGDRSRDLELLGDRTWDAVIDTCAYVPNDVRPSTKLLKERAAQYIFISTLSVYDHARIEDGTPIDESAATIDLAPGADEAVMTPETYGALKVRCEDIVVNAFGTDATILRCGIMVGPHDESDRFTYWVARCARGGRMLAPGDPSEPMQFIDVRDVAAFVVRVVEGRKSGVLNVTGIPGAVTFGTLLEHACRAAGTQPEIVWLDREAIALTGLEQWKDIPLWIEDAAFMRKFNELVVDRALRAGLTLRPLDDTIVDTLTWARTLPSDYEMKHGMTPEREAEALALAVGVRSQKFRV